MEMAIWTELIKLFGGAALGVVALAAVAKFLLSYWLKRDLVTFKSEVETAATAGVERIKAHLTQLSTEHQVRFSLLHTKRAEVISQLYEALVDAYTHTLALSLGLEITAIEVQRRRAEVALEAVRAALHLLHTRKIWLPESLAAKASALIGELDDPSLKFHYYLKERYSEQEVVEAAKQWAAKRHDVRSLLEDLEGEFRRELAEEGNVTRMPSNPTVERDARNSVSRPSP